MNVFKYKNFIGSIEVSVEDGCLHGKLLYINDLVTYEAGTVSELEIEFKKALDDYLTTCKALNKEPLKPFKGSFNVRIGPELHKSAALHAEQDGLTLNEYIKLAVQNQIQHEENRKV